MEQHVTVFGATGFTGRLICRELSRRGVPFAVAGRSRRRLEELREETGALDAVVADATRPESLGALTGSGTRVLVNCAGPFLRYGPPVVEAAVGAGVHYLDTTGEQPFMKEVADRFEDPARERGITVVPAMAFEYAVGDWIAQVAMDRCSMDTFEHVAVAYALSGEGMTRGTALSIFEMLGRPAWGWEGGRWVRRFAGSMKREVAFPWGSRTCVWAPFGEVLYLARRGTVRTATTWMRLGGLAGLAVPWANLAAWPVRPLVRPLGGIWARFAAPAPPTPEQRRASRFCIVAGADGVRAVASGTDAYGLTARIAALGAEKLMAGEVPRGVRSPATMGLDAHRALKAVGVVVE